ncbi:MAG: ABC transporter permease [Promethearchaeota archaeon]
MMEQAQKISIETQEQTKSKKKSQLIRYLKFYLIPGWRDPEFTEQEREIDKIKSKRRLFRHLLKPLTILGFLMILFILFIAIYAPWLTKYPLQTLMLPYPSGDLAFLPPSLEHPMGTAANGYDVFAKIIWGARTTILTALIPVTISIGGGLILGTISAYFGKVVDYLMMRFVEVMYAFPTLILVIILAPMFDDNLITTLIVFGILFIPYNIRFMRSIVLQVKQLEFVQAAKVGGAKKFKVMFKHIVPNALSPTLIAFFGGASIAIIGLAGIAFVGFSDPNTINWGAEIADSVINNTNLTNFSATVWPGIFIAISAIGFILIGDGLRDALDPRLKL